MLTKEQDGPDSDKVRLDLELKKYDSGELTHKNGKATMSPLLPYHLSNS